MAAIVKVAPLALCLAACPADPSSAPDAALSEENKLSSGTQVATEQPAPSPLIPAETRPAANVLTLEGLGTLKIGEPVPTGSSWGERGAQTPGPCRTISSPDLPGVYAIVEGGKVRRITIGERSRVKLIEGIATGASEAEVRAAFPGFREEPHQYVEKPARYFTDPNAAGGNPALRFEIGRDGKVSLVHAGTMPELGYVEGCA